MEALINPLQRVIKGKPSADLLDALRNAQVPKSYSCMAGRCGTCCCGTRRCEVAAGEVLNSGGKQRYPMDGDNAHVLACQTILTEPCVPVRLTADGRAAGVLCRQKGSDTARADTRSADTQLG